MSRVLNLNVGILGHVDSGKTSVAKLLSTIASTSAFDKNPQSKKRGITLDLGFSSFVVNGSLPHNENYDKIQFTLVDCPGHSSLIRTVLCGSQIIDLMLLVVDVTKGFQTQTAESLVIGAITCEQMVVVLNKCDLLPENTREQQVEKMKRRVSKTLEATIFSGAPITAISAAPGGIQMEFDQMNKQEASRSDIEALIQLLLNTVTDPTEKRKKVAGKNFLFAVDHCFSVTGQGTVMTGTVIAGTTHVGEMIELPRQKIQKKIKSIQMFRQPVNSVGPGDRAGICVPQLDPNLLERGIVGAANTGSLIPCHACILGEVKKIPYFKAAISSKARFHVFVGQETALATITFFVTCPSTDSGNSVPRGALDLEGRLSYQYLEELPGETERQVWVLLEFERILVCPEDGLVIGARLDSTASNVCRLAFHGRIVLRMPEENYRLTTLPKILVFRPKRRQGQVERIQDPRTCIVRGLFKRETNWDIFVGLRAQLLIEPNYAATGDSGTGTRTYNGRIDSSFGQSGKCRLVLNDDLPEEVVQQFLRKGAKKTTEAINVLGQDRVKIDVVLEFKRHVFDVKRRILQ